MSIPNTGQGERDKVFTRPEGAWSDPPMIDDAVSDALERVRALCLALPEVTERESHGSPTFFVRGKSTLVRFLNDHHGDGRLALWCAAPPGAQALAVEEEPERFFVPPYVGY